MQADKQHRERVALWLIEDRQEICAACEQQCAGVVHGVEHRDRGHEHGAQHHQVKVRGNRGPKAQLCSFLISTFSFRKN